MPRIIGLIGSIGFGVALLGVMSLAIGVVPVLATVLTALVVSSLIVMAVTGEWPWKLF